MTTPFPLAPMCPLIRGITFSLLLLPLLLGGIAVNINLPILAIVALLLIALYGVIWLGCRPSGFRLTPKAFIIIFPLWRRRIPLSDIADISQIDARQFQRQFGWAVRIGVGGLWGCFGWLWSFRKGWIELYISQLSEFILIKRYASNAILITPNHCKQFISMLKKSGCH